MGPQHPFADQFPNRQAWRFEKELASIARTAHTADGLQHLINRWPTLVARRRDPETAAAWRAFVDRKLAGLPWPARPEQVRATATTRTRQVMQALRGPGRPGAGPHAPAAAPPAVVFRSDTGQAAEIPEGPPFLRPAGPEIETTRPIVGSVPGGPQVLVAERQRRPGGPTPLGWVTEHVGRWPGVGWTAAEVVYNPRRYQVMLTQVGHDVSGALEAAGWQRHATDGDRVLWTRDRLSATQAALARLDHAAAIDPPAAGLRPGLALER